MIQPDKDVVTSSKLVLRISHSEDDLHLTEFTFDEVQVVSSEDDSRDLMPMPFDQHNSTLVLSMMRGMFYMLGLRLGRRQEGQREFTFTIDHDIPYGLGYTHIEDDAHHMVQLCQDRVRACLFGVPFDYPPCPYTFQLAAYFIRGSEHAPRIRGTDHALETDGIQGIKKALGKMCLSSETTGALGAMIVAPPSPG